jgi:hypothetical protein
MKDLLEIIYKIKGNMNYLSWVSRGDYFRFGSFFFLNVTKLKFLKKLKPNRNRFKPMVSVRFGFLRQKPVQTGLARFFSLAWFFSVWLGFFGLGSVRFRAYKTKTEPVGFFKILIGLIIFFTIWFFQLFFSGFIDFISFLIFLLISISKWYFLYQNKFVTSLLIWMEKINRTCYKKSFILELNYIIWDIKRN